MRQLQIVFKYISLVVVFLSLVFLMYGSIKLARLEQTSKPKIVADIPGVKVQTYHDKQQSQLMTLLFFSGGLLVIGGLGYFYFHTKTKEDRASRKAG